MKLDEIVSRFATLRIIVVGDALLDNYHFGRCDRLSPEAPIPVFLEDHLDPRGGVRRGGADNVLHQLEVLGISTRGYFPEKRSMKHRYLVGHQQLFRRDTDKYAEGDWWPVEIIDQCSAADAVVLSDYAKGALTHNLCAAVIAANRMVIVDPKGEDWSKYRHAYCLCPNQNEYAKHVNGFQCAILEKRGEEGIKIHHGGTVSLVPARSRHVFDVTGAGDTVVALAAATLAAGGTFEQAAELGNLAAGYVVGEIGTAVCPLEYLEERLKAA